MSFVTTVIVLGDAKEGRKHESIPLNDSARHQTLRPMNTKESPIANPPGLRVMEIDGWWAVTSHYTMHEVWEDVMAWDGWAYPEEVGMIASSYDADVAVAFFGHDFNHLTFTGSATP